MGKRVTAIDLREDGFSIVEMVGGRKGPYLKTFVGETWESSHPGERSRQLTKVFARQRIGRKRIVAALPLSLGRWFRLRLPALSGDALEKAVALSLQEQSQWSATEAIFGFQARKMGEQMQIDAFVFPEPAVQSRFDLLKNAGLNLRYFVPRPFGVINYLLFYPVRMPENEVAACLDFSTQETEITFFDREGLILPRSFPNPLKAENQYDTSALAGELRLVQLKLRHDGKLLTRCYLSGWMSGLNLEELTPAVTAHLGVEDGATGYLPPAGLLSVIGREGSKTPGALTTIGLALEGLGYTPALRLYPDDAEARRKRMRLSRVAAGLSVLFLLGGFYFQYSARQRNKMIISEKARLAQSVEARLTRYENLWSNRVPSLRFFTEWEKIAPEGTVITALVIEGNEVKEVSGYTPSFSTLYQRLLSSPSLRNLRIRGGIRKHREGLEAFRLSGPMGEGN